MTTTETTTHEATESLTTFVPRSQVTREDNDYYLDVELPGIAEESISIEARDNVLHVLAKIEPPTYDGLTLAREEFKFGNFEKRFRLTDEIDREGITATYENGLLRLLLPAHKPSTKTIAISSN